MTYEIVDKLDAIADSNANLIAWENVESTWQEKIAGAIAGQKRPSHLIVPKNRESLAEIVKYADRNRYPLLSCGSGSKLNWGGLVKDARLAISTQHLDRIIEHAVGDLTATVESGVKLCDLQAVLRQTNQFLPIDPAYPESATIGGIVATADSGSWRQRYGGIRDIVLGLTFVRADGQIAKAGGRVVKNVAGYDLMKLFAGSYGTLGTIIEVTFRLYPIPEASGTIVVSGEVNAIATATQTLLMSGLAPTAAEVISTGTVNRLGIGEEIGLIVRFQSIAASVKEQSAQVELVARQLGLKTSSYCDRDEIDLWDKLQQIVRVPDTKDAIVCKLGIIPNKASNFLERLDRMTTKQGLCAINISSGLGRLRLQKAEIGQLEKLRAIAEEERGFLTILEAPIDVKQKFDPWGYNGNAIALMRQIKQKFDPNNILSPGRFVGDI